MAQIQTQAQMYNGLLQHSGKEYRNFGTIKFVLYDGYWRKKR